MHRKFNKVSFSAQRKMMNDTNSRKILREILIETHSVTIIRCAGNPHNVWCESCQKVVTSFAAEQIAAAFRFAPAIIERLRQVGEIHQISHDHALLCGDSLAAYFNPGFQNNENQTSHQKGTK